MSLLSLSVAVVSRARSSVLLAVVAFATLASCDKLPLTAPTESIITLNVSTTVVPVNGTAEIIASVTEPSGTPVHNGTMVTFTSSFGAIEPREAQTAGGKATVRFIGSSQSGTAKIGAFSGSSRAEEIEILVGAAAADRIAVRAEPATVSATGGTVQLIAVVTDASGNPLPGAPVVFSVDNGSLGNNTVTTNQSGQAQTSLTTNRETVARAAVAAHEASVTIRVVSPPVVAFTSPPTSATVGVPVAFTVTPQVAAGAAPMTSVVIDFGDGSPQLNLGGITGPTGFTHTYNSEGGFTVTATATDTNGLRGVSSTGIVVTRSVPPISITASPPTGKVGDVITFTVTSTPLQGAPAVVSVEVVFVNTGQIVFSGTTGGTFSRTFGGPGSYTFQATAIDRTGARATTSISVSITP
jgi:PKD repeat protein